ncbi:acetylxylan esterase [Brachybacterium saurashtrense]|uniref:Acetylxylan esterase n=1 Tax=Brachybacterium saurashtrense TaxID=556288 RepID=A0A345YS75_9MICO|nr:acetylxylan esterase [Brachybacterium saurashtrense]AXK46777.1 acetylxylan esterase [Brachybacterium saurashtrense]RRR22492.1 acetylxylan esterase [Brachybacterium saurashtrense]
MALFDLPLPALHEYRPDLPEPDGYDAFWAEVLGRARTTEVLQEVTEVETGMSRVDTWDVTFSGHDGAPIRAWYLRPEGADDELPVVVEYIGYGGGRSTPLEHLAWPAAGYGHLVMDTRGQGSAWGSGGDTPDPAGSGPAAPGSMTRGIESPQTSYLTRLMTDAARAVDAARALPGADGRVAVTGNSQGGGLAIAAGGLVPDVAAVMANVPFLCHIRRAIDLTDADPYQEIVRYLAANRHREAAVENTLAHVDAIHHARRARGDTLFSVALRDMICPPSTVFAAFNHWADRTDAAPSTRIEVYPYNGHEGGAAAQTMLQLGWLAERMPVAR